MGSSAKKVLITGGTGFIGTKLCDVLLNEGFELYILTRNDSLPRTNNKPTQRYVNSLGELQGMNFDIVINLAGENISQRWSQSAMDSIFKSRIETTRDLVNFINEQKTKPSLFISGSAIGYYGNDSKKEFTEADENKEVDSGFASMLCKSWESEARKINPEIRTVFLRTGVVLEKDGGIIQRLYPSFILGLGSQIGDGSQWLSWIDRDDIIRIILFIINTPDIQGPVNATAPNYVTNAEFSKTLAKVLNRPCIIKAPGKLFQLIYGQMASEIILNGQKVFPKKLIDHGFKFSYPSIDESLSKISPPSKWGEGFFCKLS